MPDVRTAGRVLAAGVVVAGLVGLARQRREAEQVRRGALAPVSAITRTVPPRREGPVARAIATWVPSRPRSPLSRAVATAWSAPLTLVGLAVGYASGQRPTWDEELGCWVFTGARGGASRLFALTPATANAVGQVILTRRTRPSRPLLLHEAAHARQAERLGPFLVPLYAWWWARHGYRDHPLERGARAGARHALGQEGGSPTRNG